MRRRAYPIMALALCLGCTRGDAAPPAAGRADNPDGAGVESLAPPASASPAAVGEPGAVSEPGALRGLRTVQVEGRLGPDGNPFEVTMRTSGAVHARSFGRLTLGITLRGEAASLNDYPCTSCHMGRRVELQDERRADAHGSVGSAHPREMGATCGTCHAADVALLTLRNGERVSFDHAYRVCAQCHYAQADAWAAGVHGKRLDGWQGRRVVLGCTDCHDPHAPMLERRLPFRPPRLHRQDGGRP